MRVRSDFKKCSMCKQWLWKSKFPVDRKTKDGLYYYCYECYNEQYRQYRTGNRDMINGRQRDYRIKNFEKVKEQTRQYCMGNREQNNERERKRRIENYEKIFSRERKHRIKFPEKSVARRCVRDAIKKNEFSPPEKCIVCSSTENVQYHHESYEREHYLLVVPVCASCHGRLHGFYRAKEKNQKFVKRDEQIAKIVHEEFLSLCKG